jgi:pimeloyl-ACP methyl ester carboxylesterase
VPSYVQLGEVRTYYEEDGNGEPLVLLHPGGADSRAWEPSLPGLVRHFRVFRPDRRGHGRTPDVEGPFSYEQMAMDTIAFLERVVGGPAHLVGHSDGTPVALTAALMRPQLVRRLVLGAGVFHHDGWTPGSIDLDDDTVAFFIDYHGGGSPQTDPSTSPSSATSSTVCSRKSPLSPRPILRFTGGRAW